MRRIMVTAVALAAGVASLVVPTGGVGGPAPAAAQAPEPTLSFELGATTGIVAHQQISFTVSGLPDNWRTTGSISVCEDEPTGPTDLSSCRSHVAWGPFAYETVTGTTTFDSEAFTTSSGDINYCADEPFDCWVVATASHTGALLWAPPVPIDVTPRPVVAEGGGVHDPAAPTEVFVVGDPGATVRLAQCVAYPGVARDVGSCAAGSELTLSATGRGRATLDVTPTMTVDGVAYDCLRYPCQATVFDEAGGVFGVADLSGSLPGVTLTVDVTTGLVDNQRVTVTADSYTPGYNSVQQCLASVLDGTLGPIYGCTLPQRAQTASNTWAVSVTDTVEYMPSSITPPRACDSDPGGCVLVANLQSDGSASWYVPISFTPPALTAAPATGLQDGQTVAVTGTNVPRSYDGPRIWFVETGEWVLAECDAGIATDTTLLGLFTHCGTAVGGPATVHQGTPFTQDVTVATAVERILGGATDCTAGPGACVLALARMETNGKVTIHSTPLSFA